MGLQKLRWSLDDSKRFKKVKILSICFQLVVSQIFFMPDLTDPVTCCPSHFCYDDSYRWRTNNHVCHSWHYGWTFQYRNRENREACLHSKSIFETACWSLEKLKWDIDFFWGERVSSNAFSSREHIASRPNASSSLQLFVQGKGRKKSKDQVQIHLNKV